MTEIMNPKFDINAMRIGHYTDKYFLRTKEILTKDRYDGIVHYQYFPRKNVIVSGLDHILDIYRKCTGYFTNPDAALEIFKERQKINIHDCGLKDLQYYFGLNLTLDNMWIDKFNDISFYSLKEGSSVEEMEPCIGVIGNPKYFAHLETATLGVLSQMSAISTSVHEVCKRLKPMQSLLFFPARFRHYLSQAPDGYAAYVGGVRAMSTDANGEYVDIPGIGTIPHLLIASYSGNTARAALEFDDKIDGSVNRIALVDWDNDCIKTTLEVVLIMLQKYINNTSYMINTKLQNLNQYSKYLKDMSIDEISSKIFSYRRFIPEVIGSGKGKLYGVRFDTSGSLIDDQISKNKYNFGVCPELVFKARETFNNLGLNNLKICVSGGFDIQKIDLFQKMGVPVDMFGIGSSIVNKFSADFTADAVMLNGNPNAKIGRELKNWERMTQII